ncbi:MAG: hypothetical protein VKL20_07960 [Synechocystis sp.]|nr:hypothetical protein [Synechocystis sp.]
MAVYTLSYALKAWENSAKARQVGTSFNKNLSIVLRFYVIPGLDPEIEILKPKELTEYAKLVPLAMLRQSLKIFKEQSDFAITTGKLSPKTRNNYQSCLSQFMAWIEQQVWWKEQSTEIPEVAPFRIVAKKKPVKKKLPGYGLRQDELPDTLKQEIEEFQLFRSTGGKSLRRSRRNERREGERRGSRPKLNPAKSSTLKKELESILRFLGWLKNTYPEENLSLTLLTNIRLIDEFVYWVVTERKCSYSTAADMTATGIAIAKWQNYTSCSRRDWSDIPLILDLQDLQSEYSEIYDREKQKNQVEKWSQKELSHEEARHVVQYLAQLCAPQYGKHDPKTREFLKHGNRAISTVISAWQTYIIVKILVYCPVRQEEIRNLILGETLFRHTDDDGQPYYVVKLKEHKRSRTAKNRNYRLPSVLTADFDLWITKWHPILKESVQDVNKWMELWGCPIDKMERMQKRLSDARKGIVSERVQQPIEDYIQQEEVRVQGVLNRYEAFDIVKQNLESHNYLFFVMGEGQATAFGTPHTVTSIWQLVTGAISQATTALYGEAKWTNPHALRHIAEKHIRLLNKSDKLETFATLIGHSKEMGDEYANQILTDYDLSKNIVDDWWL